MYFYIVDPQKITQTEFERVQNVLYSSLSEYRISGEVVRVTGLRTIAQLVENAFAHEAKTIVAVGSDETLHDIINAIGSREIVVGFIPLVDSEIGEILGIKDLILAVRTIAFRRIQELDLGFIQETGYYFFSKLFFGPAKEPFELKFKVNDEYTATQNIVSGIISSSDNPKDGLLSLNLLPQISKWQSLFRQLVSSVQHQPIPNASIIHTKKIEIFSPEGLQIRAGDRIVVKTPATIALMPGMLKMIVGRERSF